MFGFALQALAAFNLVCTGESVPSYAERRPFVLNLRVDLESQRYCMDRCDRTLPIASVTDSDIIFHNGPTLSSTVYRTVNRESGRYYSDIRTPLGGRTLRTVDAGHCVASAFTGFPARRF